jgi:hypothetical protein
MTRTPAQAAARSPRHDHHSPDLDQHDTPTEDNLTTPISLTAAPLRSSSRHPTEDVNVYGRYYHRRRHPSLTSDVATCSTG